jgi:hypothetical protein
VTSLLLDTQTWDLTLDAYGNIALAREPYAIAQDVACALRLFSAELWYDTTQGLPYLTQILGKRPPAGFIKAQMEATALTVTDVDSAKAFITGLRNRELTGQVQVTMMQGTIQATLIAGPGAPWYVSAVTP